MKYLQMHLCVSLKMFSALNQIEWNPSASPSSGWRAILLFLFTAPSTNPGSWEKVINPPLFFSLHLFYAAVWGLNMVWAALGAFSLFPLSGSVFKAPHQVVFIHGRLTKVTASVTWSNLGLSASHLLFQQRRRVDAYSTRKASRHMASGFTCRAQTWIQLREAASRSGGRQSNGKTEPSEWLNVGCGPFEATTGWLLFRVMSWGKQPLGGEERSDALFVHSKKIPRFLSGSNRVGNRSRFLLASSLLWPQCRLWVGASWPAQHENISNIMLLWCVANSVGEQSISS